jgi:deoxyadenosine/deoxycytidine kinase
VHLVGVVGIPGAGKSTLMKRLQKQPAFRNALAWYGIEPHIVFVKERSREWEQEGLLDQFYGDPDHYAAPFQFRVFDSHVDAVREAIRDARRLVGKEVPIVAFVERTIYCQLLFWRLQVDQGRRTADAAFDAAYERLWHKWAEKLPPVSLVFFLVTSDIQYVMQRVRARARAAELGMSISSSTESLPLQFELESPSSEPIEDAAGLTTSYQRMLLEKHHEWYAEPKAHPPHGPPGGINCAHINVDAPLHLDDAVLANVAHNIAEAVALMLLD